MDPAAYLPEMPPKPTESTNTEMPKESSETGYSLLIGLLIFIILLQVVLFSEFGKGHIHNHLFTQVLLLAVVIGVPWMIQKARRQRMGHPSRMAAMCKRKGRGRTSSNGGAINGKGK